MTRRDFLYGSSAAAGTALLSQTSAYAAATNAGPIDAKAFHASRKFADLPISRVAYVERGRGLRTLEQVPSASEPAPDRSAADQ